MREFNLRRTARALPQRAGAARPRETPLPVPARRVLSGRNAPSGPRFEPIGMRNERPNHIASGRAEVCPGLFLGDPHRRHTLRTRASAHHHQDNIAGLQLQHGNGENAGGLRRYE